MKKLVVLMVLAFLVAGVMTAVTLHTQLTMADSCSGIGC